MIELDQAGPLRVALVSDTHGALDPRVAELVAGCDLAVHGGDIGDLSVLAALQPRGRVFAVHGNNDRTHSRPADESPSLRHLPEVLQLRLPGGVLAVIHGHQFPASGRHGLLRQRFPRARVIVYGHSHELVVDRECEPWVVNPGAAGRVRTHGGPSCLILTAAEARWTLVVQRFALLPRRRHTPPRSADKAALSA
ncbi:metallophosphoesterase family protein [Thiococcus pfennigii]|uniref:metallophosphoesterase family protein n=1 Tax=Thiococcus pfennigii TaxID=1057 RepID=UPI001906D905|nr:metallophosphoesterase family protein [Thiococcus pfennigii]MBK1730981.1 YfcE family phosphodiesterase [Thiococcus pfennigii]